MNGKYKNVEIDVKGRKGEHYGVALAFWSPSGGMYAYTWKRGIELAESIANVILF